MLDVRTHRGGNCANPGGQPLLLKLSAEKSEVTAMSKTAKLAVIVVAAASIATPALAQVADPQYAPPLYNYYPPPDIGVAAPYSNFPAATGGGSYGYNVGVLKDGG
jgi:hypothetical protein